MLFVSNVGFDWLDPSLLRFYEANRNEPGTFATFVYIFIFIVLISAVVTTPIWVFGGLGMDQQAPAYALGIVLAWSYSWFELVSTFEIANFRPLWNLRMNLSRAILIIVGAGGAAWITRDPFWTAIFTGVGILGGAVHGSFRFQRLKPRYFNRKLAIEVIKFGLPVAITMTMVGLMNNGTRALLEMLDSAKGLGLYTAAFAMIQQPLILVGSSISAASFSLAVRAVEGKDHIEVRRQILDNGTLLLAVMAPACLGLALTAHGFVNILLGSEFRSIAIVLAPWLAAGAFFSCIRSYFFDNAFTLGRRPILLVWVYVVAAVLAVGLSILLIPRMGPVGAAIAVTAAQAVSCCHSAIVGRSVFPMSISIGAMGRILLCCVFMALIVLSIPTDGTVGFLLQVAFGAIGYCCAAIALNVLNLRTHVVSYISGRRQ
jgi:O-antigen/teichoic acid export membrane protein